MNDPFQLLGTVIEGRYRVDAVIGEGGFGVVYRGYNLRLDHPVAVKCLRVPEHFTKEARTLFLDRFREEGRILLKLADTPGVLRVFDFGLLTDARGMPIPYMALEWLEGQTLEEAMARRLKAGRGGMSASEATRLLLPAIDALAVAHQHQIAHRDVKPANMFLVRSASRQTLKVLDFGIAKAMQEGELLTRNATKTEGSFRAFTPNYAAPEQFAPKRYGGSGPWTDVHALGLLLVELVVGRSALPGEELIEFLEAATAEQRPTPRTLGASVPDAFEAICAKALARASHDRFPSALELAEALRHFLAAQPVTQGAPEVFELPPQTQRVPSPISGGDSAFSAAASAFSAGVPDPTGMRGSSPSLSAAQVQQMATARTAIPIVQASTNVPGAGGMTAFAGPPLHTAEGVSISGPRIAAAPTTARRSSGGKRALIALGSLAVLGGAGAGAYFLFLQPGEGKGSDKKADAGVPVEPETSVVNAMDYAWGKDFHPIAEIDDAKAKGRWHYRITREGGKVTKLDRVNPAGVVTELGQVRLSDDGKTVVVQKRTPSGTLKETETRTEAGDALAIHTRVERSGITTVDGCGQIRFAYSPAGDVVERTCLDAQGHVIIDNSGCQVRKSEYDSQHRITSTACHAEDKRPVLDSTGVHLRRFSYGDLGLVTERSFFDTKGLALSDANGCQRNRFNLDGAGNIIDELCAGPTGMLTPFTGTTAAGQTAVYDGNGCKVKSTFVDPRLQPVLVFGLQSFVYEVDARCNQTAYSKVDAAGALVGRPQDPAKRTYKYDAEDNVVEERCFDAKNSPQNCSAQESMGDKGSLLKRTYDERGHMLTERAYDGNGTPTPHEANYPHEFRMEYSAAGFQNAKQGFDEQGNPTAMIGLVSRTEFRYDALGAFESYANFDAAKRPVADATGVHEMRYVYDDKHRLQGVELRDTSMAFVTKNLLIHNGVTWPKQACRLALEHGEFITNRYFDAAGKEVQVVACDKPETPCYR